MPELLFILSCERRSKVSSCMQSSTWKLDFQDRPNLAKWSTIKFCSLGVCSCHHWHSVFKSCQTLLSIVMPKSYSQLSDWIVAFFEPFTEKDE